MTILLWVLVLFTVGIAIGLPIFLVIFPFSMVPLAIVSLYSNGTSALYRGFLLLIAISLIGMFKYTIKWRKTLGFKGFLFALIGDYTNLNLVSIPIYVLMGCFYQPVATTVFLIIGYIFIILSIINEVIFFIGLSLVEFLCGA